MNAVNENIMNSLPGVINTLGLNIEDKHIIARDYYQLASTFLLIGSVTYFKPRYVSLDHIGCLVYIFISLSHVTYHPLHSKVGIVPCPTSGGHR